MTAKKSMSAKPVSDMNAPLSEEELNELHSLMALRHPNGPLFASATRLHGFLTSVISGPLMLPSEWMNTVFAGPDELAWKDLEQGRRAETLLLRFHDQVAEDLRGDDYNVLIDCEGDGPNDRSYGDDWCSGYILGMLLREEEWKPALDDPELSEFLDPIFAIANPEKAGQKGLEDDQVSYDKMLDGLPECAIAVYDWWRDGSVSADPAEPVRRATPKISPNAPCPCGSGKKHKRCCSPLRAG